MNGYRVRDRYWEITSYLEGTVLRQPSIFIGGAADPSLPFFWRDYDQFETFMPGLQKKILLEGAGHSAAEEQLLLSFIAVDGWSTY